MLVRVYQKHSNLSLMFKKVLKKDEKQDELIEQLQRNQQALTQVIDANQKAIIFDTELPKAIEGAEEENGIRTHHTNIDNFLIEITEELY